MSLDANDRPDWAAAGYNWPSLGDAVAEEILEAQNQFMADAEELLEAQNELEAARQQLRTEKLIFASIQELQREKRLAMLTERRHNWWLWLLRAFIAGAVASALAHDLWERLG